MLFLRTLSFKARLRAPKRRSHRSEKAQAVVAYSRVEFLRILAAPCYFLTGQKVVVFSKGQYFHVKIHVEKIGMV